MLSDKEKKVISAIQGDLPLDPRPYKILAENLAMSEDEFMDVLISLDQRKMIRRFGATLRHQKTGFTANAMVAWNIPEEGIIQAGETMSSFKEVSHCYRRDPKPGWPYNLYTMVHAKSREECRAIVDTMAKKAGFNDYTMLFSVKELKKTSMRYFEPEDQR